MMGDYIEEHRISELLMNSVDALRGKNLKKKGNEKSHVEPRRAHQRYGHLHPEEKGPAAVDESWRARGLQGQSYRMYICNTSKCESSETIPSPSLHRDEGGLKLYSRIAEIRIEVIFKAEKFYRGQRFYEQ
jgi:hypothetical protein